MPQQRFSKNEETKKKKVLKTYFTQYHSTSWNSRRSTNIVKIYHFHILSRLSNTQKVKHRLQSLIRHGSRRATSHEKPWPGHSGEPAKITVQYGLYSWNTTRLEEPQKKVWLFSAHNETPVGPCCSHSLVGSLWRQRTSYHVREHQSSQIITRWWGKCYGFPLSVHSSAFLQGNVESVPTCTGMARRIWQIRTLVHDDNKWCNYQIHNKARNWKITNSAFISHYPIYLKITWKECSGKSHYEFWKSVKKTIRPCKRHLSNLWAISWPLITFIPAVCVLDLLKCSISWGRYSVLSECLRAPCIRDLKQLCKQKWQCLSGRVKYRKIIIYICS